MRLVHLDETLVVVRKPEGMLVHRGMGASREETFLLQAVRDLVGARIYPVHRLDRPTSGLVVFGRTSEASRSLQDLWREGRVRKTYRAIARGWLPQESSVHDEALDDPDSGILQEARTSLRELERCEIGLPLPRSKHPTSRWCLVELEPITGRWHQLRRHLSRLQHPIAGDTTHGDRHVNHFLQERFGWWRLMLWAHRLRFPHPRDGQEVTFDDAPENGLDTFWELLKKS